MWATQSTSSLAGNRKLSRRLQKFFLGLAILSTLAAAYHSLHGHTKYSPLQRLPDRVEILRTSTISNIPVQEEGTYQTTSSDLPSRGEVKHISENARSPFTGAFAKFPALSSLPARQRRMTIVGVWSNDSFPYYLRHFFYTIQLNADVLDLVMINRVATPESKCLDFEKAGVNITWGGNIKFHCIDDKEWKRRHVAFLCSAEYGWNCNKTEFEEVTQEYQKREDEKNFNWRPFRGYVFRDLFINPNNPFWGWMDHDVMLGNFARYPFNILSQVSLVTGSHAEPSILMMAGQLTAFNLDDASLATTWKKLQFLKTANHFTKYIEGEMPESAEEKYWSYGYLQSKKELPGSELSYVVYSDLHGDDFYEGKRGKKPTSETYLISGRDVLLAKNTFLRREIEDIFQLERSTAIDDLGGIGWTGGEDGSAHLLSQPTLTSSEAKHRAIEEAKASSSIPKLHEGIVEDIFIQTNRCRTNFQGDYKICVDGHPTTRPRPNLMRSSLVHFKEQQPNHLLRRLEPDTRHRAYERKFLKHILYAKKWPWFELPNFDITEDMVLKYNTSTVEVFKMGASRDVTLFYRSEDGLFPNVG